MLYYQFCTFLCVVYTRIKVVYGCWGNADYGPPPAGAYDDAQNPIPNLVHHLNETYGGYGEYFVKDADAYGLNAAGNIDLWGPGGPDTIIDENVENALLPGGVPSADALKKIFENKWDAWLIDYYKKKELHQQEELSSAELKERQDPFWPAKLLGKGKGQGGEPPPPYAYIQTNDEGFPSLCFLSIEKGRYAGVKCTPGPRYGFVIGTKICVTFYYRGCGGNQNNFKDKKICEDTCTKVPDSGCDPNTKQIGRVIIDYALGRQ